MCGIYGYFDTTGPRPAPAALDDVGGSLHHRGPDDTGEFRAPGVVLGNRRLSIIDIDGGHQPFVSDDGQVAVVQNGEIFNHVELAAELAAAGYPCRTHCDTEVLLRLYEQHGDLGFLPRLNGMFAFAVYDARQQAVHIARDRIGIKPLYLHADNGRVWFASEIKALLHAGAPRAADPEALYHFLTFNYVPAPWTMFKGIRHLMPGHAMTARRNGQTDTWQWWDLTACKAEERSEAEWIEVFNETLEDAVRIRLRADVPYGAFLSGGVDSSTIVGLMSRLGDEPVHTFCIGFDDPRFDESPYAAAAAERFGTHHTLKIVRPDMLEMWPLATYFCDQPHGDVSFMPTWHVAALAAEHVKVVLTGDGGDELFAGYDKHRDFFGAAAREAEDTDAFRQAYYRNLALFDNEQKQRVLSPGLKTATQSLDSWDVVKPLFDRASGMDRINQALFLDMAMLLPGNNLVKPDRMGMAVSLEARTPFLDYRMMELAFRMPGSLKLKDGETKYIMKKAVTPLIGEALAYRRKQMFTVPIGEWLRTGPAWLLERLLLEGPALDRDLFEADRIREMHEAHRAGTANYTRELRALMAVEIWHRLFIDELWQSPPTLTALLDSDVAAAGAGTATGLDGAG
jgi:asparagine synthase (glutamine-hydrolysing)